MRHIAAVGESPRRFICYANAPCFDRKNEHVATFDSRLKFQWRRLSSASSRVPFSQVAVHYFGGVTVFGKVLRMLSAIITERWRPPVQPNAMVR